MIWTRAVGGEIVTVTLSRRVPAGVRHCRSRGCTHATLTARAEIRHGGVVIRALREGNLDAVAALVELRLHDSHGAWPTMQSFLRASLLENPWADDELPSLVADRDGVVTASSWSAYVARGRQASRS